MIWIVQTTDGAFVQADIDGGKSNMTEEQAQASVKERNARAEALGIETRYEVGER